MAGKVARGTMNNLYECVAIDRSEWKTFVLKRHYLKRIPPVSYAFGLRNIETNKIEGVCLFGIPASRSACVGVCGEDLAAQVLELNRIALNDGLPKNSASWFVSRCLKSLPKNSIVISWADTGVGHIGYVYQALNFIYTGCSKLRTDIGSTGHPRHGRNRDLPRQIRTPKHRYVWFARNKERKKLLWESMPYPKGDTSKTCGVNVDQLNYSKQDNLFEAR